jgi:hypothetical protein
MAADDGTSRSTPTSRRARFLHNGSREERETEDCPTQPCERSVPLIENCGLDTLELLYFAAVLRFNVANDILSGRLVNDYI